MTRSTKCDATISLEDFIRDVQLRSLVATGVGLKCGRVSLQWGVRIVHCRGGLASGLRTLKGRQRGNEGTQIDVRCLNSQAPRVGISPVYSREDGKPLLGVPDGVRSERRETT